MGNFSSKDTLDEAPLPRPRGTSTAGVLLVSSDGRPMLRVFPCASKELLLSREALEQAGVLDHLLSRQHARVTYVDRGWVVSDLASRNGTFLDGQRLDGTGSATESTVLRIGSCLFVFRHDITPYEGKTSFLQNLEEVAGPMTSAVFAAVERAGADGRDLLIRGETGSGKEIAAKRFHEATGQRGGIVSVNCASIPESIAERVLFGAKKGAYSGAVTDATGYLAAADGGVLFLDEVGELPLEIQAKLLRFLETREVTPLGATVGRKVDVRICFATNRDLRASINDGQVRADFYYRLRAAEVTLPPLRQRRDEIPWLAQNEAARRAPGLGFAPRALEALMLHDWPGNVRELLADVREAVSRAQADDSTVIRVEHLRFPPPDEILPTRPPSSRPPTDSMTAPAAVRPEDVSEEALRESLERNRGVQEKVWRELGLSSRHVLTRLLRRYGISGS